ncbi:MAG: hypothetical protein ACREYE_08930 [Gammaproteobacteria bacterium]
MKKPTALGISRSGGARNPHVSQYTLRFLRSGGTRPSFARDGFFTNSQMIENLPSISRPPRYGSLRAWEKIVASAREAVLRRSGGWRLETGDWTPQASSLQSQASKLEHRRNTRSRAQQIFSQALRPTGS